MKELTIQLNNYIDIYGIIHNNINEYNILIDFHNRKKWIASNNITVTLIPRENDFYIIKPRNIKRINRYLCGNYIIDKRDNSIRYITGIFERYEYINNENFGKTPIDVWETSRDEIIGCLNKDSDVFIDNGPNKTEYNTPDLFNLRPYEKINYNSDKDYMLNPYIVEVRKNNVINLYDRRTKQLKHVCNIGKRYEYIFKGTYRGISSSYSGLNHDSIIQLIPHKEDKWIQFHTMISFDDYYPFTIHEREDGGVDLLSKKDNALKYICNIGKRFYYIPK
jgi:hypothetical protein